MNIVYSKHAAKAISGMDSATKQRIWGGICKIPEGDIKPMKAMRTDGSGLGSENTALCSCQQAMACMS